jgi:hypothetical protein
MTTKSKIQKINFSKFFPDDGGFVTLTGMFDPNIPKDMFHEDFDMDLTIQTSTGHFINLYSWLSNKDNTLQQLKAINDATAKAIKFYEDSAAAKKEIKKSKPIDFAPKRVLKTRK